jgi:hypothetical protein
MANFEAINHGIGVTESFGQALQKLTTHTRMATRFCYTVKNTAPTDGLYPTSPA